MANSFSFPFCISFTLRSDSMCCTVKVGMKMQLSDIYSLLLHPHSNAYSHYLSDCCICYKPSWTSHYHLTSRLQQGSLSVFFSLSFGRYTLMYIHMFLADKEFSLLHIYIPSLNYSSLLPSPTTTVHFSF